MDQRTCDMPECNNRHQARGLCSTHYNQAHQPNRHKDSAAQSKARRERDQLNPAKRDAERERQRKKRERYPTKQDPWPGLTDITNRLPREIDSEMRKLERLHLVKCEQCEAKVLTAKGVMRFCSKRCKRQAVHHRRRASKRGARGTHTRSEVLDLWRSIGRMCGYCEFQVAKHRVQGDHFISLAYGGPDSIDNMVPACPSCNADKRELSMDEWRADRIRRGLEPLSLSLAITNIKVLATA